MRHLSRALSLALILCSGPAALASTTETKAPEAPQKLDLSLPALEPMATIEVGGGATLSLEQVLQSAQESYPPMRQAQLKVKAVEGKLLASEGAFDLKLKGKARATPIGYYDYERLDLALEQPTPFWGASLTAGYRTGVGRFPVYYENYETLQGGEFRLGLRMPLLRGRSVDEGRAGLRMSRALLSAEQGRMNAKMLAAQVTVAEAYWKWVAAGLKLKLAAELLGLAEDRETQLERMVQVGSRPEIDLLENRRAILARRQGVISAQRKLEKASLKLSLYWRKENAPIRPGARQVPLNIAVQGPLGAEEGSAWLQRALAERPEVDAAQHDLIYAETKLELADNNLAPRLDVEVVGSRDLGGGSEKLQKTLAPWVMETGVVLEIPFQRRKAKGKRQEAAAKRDSLLVELDWTKDKIRNEVEDLLSAREAARLKAEITQEGLRVSQQVALAERKKLLLGATDLVKLNLVEQYAFSAASKNVEALADLQIAHARLRAATMLPVVGP